MSETKVNCQLPDKIKKHPLTTEPMGPIIMKSSAP